MTNRAHCKKCRAEIFFAISEQTGRRIPLDPHPDVKGNIWLDYEGLAHVVSATDPAPIGSDLYISHFAGCPGAKEFRRYEKKRRR